MYTIDLINERATKFTTYLDPSKRTLEVTDKLTHDLKGPDAPIIALHRISEWVFFEIMHVPEEVNNFESPDEVMKLESADCDGKAILTDALVNSLPEHLKPSEVGLIIGTMLVPTEMLLFGIFPIWTMKPVTHVWVYVTPIGADTRPRIIDATTGQVLIAREARHYTPHTIVTANDIKIY